MLLASRGSPMRIATDRGLRAPLDSFDAVVLVISTVIRMELANAVYELLLSSGRVGMNKMWTKAIIALFCILVVHAAVAAPYSLSIRMRGHPMSIGVRAFSFDAFFTYNV